MASLQHIEKYLLWHTEFDGRVLEGHAFLGALHHVFTDRRRFIRDGRHRFLQSKKQIVPLVGHALVETLSKLTLLPVPPQQPKLGMHCIEDLSPIREINRNVFPRLGIPKTIKKRAPLYICPECFHQPVVESRSLLVRRFGHHLLLRLSRLLRRWVFVRIDCQGEMPYSDEEGFGILDVVVLNHSSLQQCAVRAHPTFTSIDLRSEIAWPPQTIVAFHPRNEEQPV